MINLVKRYLYKRYQKGKCTIIVKVYPDHHADCMEIGHVRKINFKSGNDYSCKLIKSIYSTHGFYSGVYEINNDIQELTYDQFNAFNLRSIKITDRKIKVGDILSP